MVWLRFGTPELRDEWKDQLRRCGRPVRSLLCSPGYAPALLRRSNLRSLRAIDHEARVNDFTGDRALRPYGAAAARESNMLYFALVAGGHIAARLLA